MVRPKRTNEELQKASEHLFYEIWMFTSLAKGMTSGVFGEGVINNAALESFTIHARAILDFLYSDRPKPDDVVAEDYFLFSEEWYNKRPSKSEVLQSVHRRVGKEVAHLTYIRQEISPKMKEWNFIQIANEINAVFTCFLENVPIHLLGPIWDKMIIQPTDDKRSKVYFIYENWVSEGHKARIHFGECPYCKFGKGIHRAKSKKNGQWLGPFSTLQEVVEAAEETGGRISKCKHCNPH